MINVLDIQKHIDSSVPWPLLVKVGKLSSILSAIKAIKNRNTDKKICVALSSGVVDMVSLASDTMSFIPSIMLQGPVDDFLSRTRDFDILVVEAEGIDSGAMHHLTDMTLNAGLPIIILER